ncbi:putative ribonuclease H-like domain-containing protein [Tanacetum coccineum]
MKSGIKTLNTAGQNFLKAAVSVNTARPINTAYPRPIVNSARTTSNVFNRAHSHVRRPFKKSTTNKKSNLKEKVNTVKGNVTTMGHKQYIQSVMAWWNALMHMTGNKSYLSDYEEINGGFVAFGGDPKGGKITSKGKISTEDRQKNSVLIDIEVVVLSPTLSYLMKTYHLCKFDGKADEGFFIGYSTNSKAYRVFNSRTRIVEENLHVKFSEETSNIAGNGPNCLFDIDALTISMNYKPVITGNTTMDSLDARFKPLGEEEKMDFEHPENEDSEVPNTKESRIIKSKMQMSTSLTTLILDKKDERGIVIRNKARIEVIRLFLAYASFKDFVVYQMDVKSAFLYGKIEEEVYVCQPPGSTKKSLCIEFEKLMHKKFQMSSMGEITFFLGLQVTQKYDGIFISQDKYVDEILKKFGFSTVKTASTPMETSKPLLKDAEAEDVDVYLYRSMIGSLMYLIASRPDIMFDVCACARFQVTPKVSHLHAVKRIFRYLKGQPKLGLWYPKDSPFDLEAYTDSDYAGASLDKKSTTGGCQFLGRRLISWQCKKQTIVANSTTKAEYVVASSCCGQVLWIQNQMLDYGYNFMNTKIFIDNESTICIVKNPLFHSKTKHIEIRHHFIRDSYEKRLIQVIKIHTYHNVADLLINAFDVSRFQYLIAIDENVIKEWEDKMERAATTASSLEA